MREKPDFVKTGVFSRRITPAYAGKTRAQPYSQFLHKDHPRVCGKNVQRPRKRASRLGSPPRMREKLVI